LTGGYGFTVLPYRRYSNVNDKRDSAGTELSRVCSGASFTFTQEGNTPGTTDEFETLTINLEYQMPEKPEDCFIVIKTEGWSVSDGDELKELVDKCVKAIVEIMKQ
jgi:hypothetical protein